MDSLPYMRRKLLEPKDKSLLTVAMEESNGNISRRALTPLGLSTGAPPPAASATAMLQGNGRGIRRGSVDSASAYYASSTVPSPSIPEKSHEAYRERKEPNQHRFVKSSFAKRRLSLCVLAVGRLYDCSYQLFSSFFHGLAVECRLCHEPAKKQAVICQGKYMSPR